MNELKNINQIELHYFFNDKSHTLDAFTRNKCEAEFLLIVKEVLTTFDIEIDVNCITPQDGGFKEIWEFLGKNSPQISAISAIVSPIIAITLYLLSQEPKQDNELLLLQKEELRLSIEEKKLKLKNLEKSNENTEKLTTEEILSIVKLFENNFKIIKHRSNFYENISKVEKVTKITTSTMYNYNIVEEFKTIEKNEFPKFIVLKNDLPLEIIEDAEIEIISPILKQGNFKWKGIYKDEQIDFYMKDKEFKKSIFEGKVSFSSGFNIKCVLEIKSVLDEVGNIKIKSYSVTTVIAELIFDNNKTTEKQTNQGKQYLSRKKELEQPNLFDLVAKSDKK
ncbi:hypothetical protein CRU98_08500 [Arcobacter sp. CECT 8986]|uniref:hypothetical protein n=1 Tax=Arcobacter sp. CECT 8986 TaxID=2044507 RepID=UPI0010099E12|nr:hypothetical protein [Arcobacter sp. CECT 8986]RXJ98795.1 hypothetical protein CRU98_08500 [Arcobacter sp. CECT 8986]